MLSENILYLSAGELAKKIEARAISPVELTESYLARAEKFGPKLNAFATLTPDLALEQAHAAEREIKAGRYRGPLHGIPYAAKDLLAVKGYPTTWGVKPFAKQVFDENAAAIEHLNRAGAVLIGKAAMIELAGGMGYRFASASATGAAKNPWNTGCWTCGSSSGSGAIVSAALAAWAIGTETWGSIVCPAAFCGVTGLRPTFGRVSRYGTMALAYSMDKIGPLARTADDCARVLSVIAAHDARDPGTLPLDRAAFSYSAAQDLHARPLRVGWVVNAWKDKDLQAGVGKVAKEAMRVVRRHAASVKDVRLPEGPWDEAGGVIVNVESASAYENLITSGRTADLTDPLGQIAGYVNQQISGSDYLHADRVRAIAQKRMAELFDDYDVLAAPTLPVAATPLEMNLEKDLSFPDPLGALGNMCGLPAVSVPCGLNEKALPVGLLFVAKAGNDLAAVQAARTFQQYTNWHKAHPPLH
ncbi:MAG: amidase [Candidatus Acidiferrales bacterium]|jgi:aspartyl-tRNA(Asn)/glutamyl-tRNA(Gln) amidotransferase subunit A